jgi:hypothetical protein
MTIELDLQVRARLLEKFESRLELDDDDFIDKIGTKVDILKPKLGKQTTVVTVT